MKLVPFKRQNHMANRTDIDRLFEDFFTDWPLANNRSLQRVEQDFTPNVNIAETEKGYRLTAELPGLQDKDFEVFVEDNALNLKGEKRSEVKEEGENFHRIETTYGSFHRSFQLPESVDTENVNAIFKNGVLTVDLTKDEKISKRKKIEVRH